MRLPESLRRLRNRLAGREPNIEDERLFALFRNRVELKKELTALDDDRHRLLDRLRRSGASRAGGSSSSVPNSRGSRRIVSARPSSPSSTAPGASAWRWWNAS